MSFEYINVSPQEFSRNLLGKVAFQAFDLGKTVYYSNDGDVIGCLDRNAGSSTKTQLRYFITAAAIN